MVSHRPQINKVIFGLLFLVVACGRPEKSQPDDPSVPTAEGTPGEEIPSAFRAVQQEVFMTRCQQCHERRGVFTFEDYNTVVANLELIEQRVFVERNMPPGGPLTESQEAILRTWIDTGGPL